jgi:hypothetical protein
MLLENGMSEAATTFKQRLRIACLHLVTAGLLGQGRLKTQDPTGFAQLDCNKAVRRVIIGCGGRSVLQADFHWSLLCG